MYIFSTVTAASNGGNELVIFLEPLLFWRENIVKTGHDYQSKASLLLFRGRLGNNFDSEMIRKLHQDEIIDVLNKLTWIDSSYIAKFYKFDKNNHLLCPFLFDNELQLFPIEYIEILRIYYSNDIEMDTLWKIYDQNRSINSGDYEIEITDTFKRMKNKENEIKMETYALSISNEIKVFKLLKERLGDLKSFPEIIKSNASRKKLRFINDLITATNRVLIILQSMCENKYENIFNSIIFAESQQSTKKDAMLLDFLMKIASSNVSISSEDELKLKEHEFNTFGEVLTSSIPHQTLSDEKLSPILSIYENFSLCSYFSQVLIPLLKRTRSKVDMSDICKANDMVQESSTSGILRGKLLQDRHAQIINPGNGDLSSTRFVTVEKVADEQTKLLYYSNFTANINIDRQDLDCRLVWRRMFELNPSTDIEIALTRDGAGAFSSVLMKCCTVHENKTNEDETCKPARNRLTQYNNVIAIAISLTSSLVITGPAVLPALYDDQHAVGLYSACVNTNRNDDGSIQSHSIQTFPPLARWLNLGLGGGEIHSFLLLHHSCLDVESVELSRDVYELAVNDLQLGSVCQFYADIEQAINEPIDQSCRSRVIISDGWKYLKTMASRLDSATPPTTPPTTSTASLYDFINLDMFNASATIWHGSPNEGTSNAHIDLATEDESLLSLRSLLNPTKGLAIIHMHEDQHFKRYVRRIQQVFEKAAGHTDESNTVSKPKRRYTATFVITDNSKIVIATPNGFSNKYDDAHDSTRIPHPCDNLKAFAQRSVSFALDHQYPVDIATKFHFSPLCD